MKHMPKLEADAVIKEEFVYYWTAEEEAALNQIATR